MTWGIACPLFHSLHSFWSDLQPVSQKDTEKRVETHASRDILTIYGLHWNTIAYKAGICD